MMCIGEKWKYKILDIINPILTFKISSEVSRDQDISRFLSPTETPKI